MKKSEEEKYTAEKLRLLMILKKVVRGWISIINKRDENLELRAQLNRGKKGMDKDSEKEEEEEFEVEIH